MSKARRIKILFTSAGRRVALMRAFRESLHRLGLMSQIYAGDAKKNAPALFVADEKVLLPQIQDPNWIPTLKQFCQDQQIDLVVPLIDPELIPLSRHREEFAAQGTTLLVCDEETNRISNDKNLTEGFFRKHDIDTPRLLSIDELEHKYDWKQPVLMKPADGSSSVGVVKIYNLEELHFFWNRTPNPMIQSCIKGQEYTVDVLVDFSGHALCAVPRMRIETRAGEVSKGITCKSRDIMDAARRVAEALPGARGCLTIQCFRVADTGKLSFIEINPRFGGGYPLSYAAGADYPGWILAQLAGLPFRIEFDGWRDGVAMLRYDAAVFPQSEELA
ncbi:MAG TPA: ATP-grasp domain-containing protein [Pirellulales bacterium]|nr:ATP-grasp domain-containing protein [Pirellulales bacterium]